MSVAPALAVAGPGVLPRGEEEEAEEQSLGLEDSILWMAAPKKRRTIEVNRTRRRAQEKLLKVKVPFLELMHGLKTDLKPLIKRPFHVAP